MRAQSTEQAREGGQRAPVRSKLEINNHNTRTYLHREIFFLNLKFQFRWTCFLFSEGPTPEVSFATDRRGRHSKGSVAEGKLDWQELFVAQANKFGLHSKGNTEPQKPVEPERDVVTFVSAVVPLGSRVGDGSGQPVRKRLE